MTFSSYLSIRSTTRYTEHIQIPLHFLSEPFELNTGTKNISPLHIFDGISNCLIFTRGSIVSLPSSDQITMGSLSNKLQLRHRRKLQRVQMSHVVLAAGILICFIPCTMAMWENAVFWHQQRIVQV